MSWDRHALAAVDRGTGKGSSRNSGDGHLDIITCTNLHHIIPKINYHPYFQEAHLARITDRYCQLWSLEDP